MSDIIPQDTPESKQCRICKQILPLASFSKQKAKLRNECRTCASEQYKLYYQKNKEKRKKDYAKWEQEHKEERLRYYAQRNEANREYHREFARQYHQEHKEERAAYRAQYRQSEHGKQTEKAYERSERGRAVRRAIGHKRRIASHYRRNSFTGQQFLEQLKRQRYQCYYCQERHTEKDFVWHADHVVPISRGGSNDISNIVAACPACNQKKANKLPHEWNEGGRLL